VVVRVISNEDITGLLLVPESTQLRGYHR